MLQAAFAVPVVAAAGMDAYPLRRRFQKPALAVSVACAVRESSGAGA